MVPKHPIWYPYTMAINIKDPEVERLVGEVAAVTHETKTRAIRVALEERNDRLAAQAKRRERGERLRRFLEEEAWPQLPEQEHGRPLSKVEREEILGYGPEGV